MEDPVFGDEEITFLRECIFDPAASCRCEFLSGAVNWSDERFSEFVLLPIVYGRGFAKHLFARHLFEYRTSLLVGRPREELRFAWDAARAACPEWIGFRPERTTPAPHWPGFVESELDGYFRVPGQ